MKTLTDIAAIICIGLLVGTEFAVAAFINPILRKLGAREELRAIALFAQKLGFVMPFWYCASLLLLIAELIIRRADAGSVMLLVSSGAIWAAVIVLTILYLVPINNRMARIDANSGGSPELNEHGRWDKMHRWRVAALGTALVCFLLAVVRPG